MFLLWSQGQQYFDQEVDFFRQNPVMMDDTFILIQSVANESELWGLGHERGGMGVFGRV